MLASIAIDFPLVTRRLLVRPYRMDDQAQIAARFMEIQKPYLQADEARVRAEHFLEKVLRDDPRQHITLAGFSQKDDRTLITYLSANVTGFRPGEWAIGYHTREAFRGQGYMCECVRGVLPLFRMLSAQFVVASTGIYNKGSSKVLENAGFARTPGVGEHLKFHYAL